jgi:hypothetical protein
LKIALKASEEDGESFGVKLLSDIRDYFAEKKAERASTVDLLEYLHGLEERPWSCWGRRQEPMKSHQLAQQLRKYGISARKIRFGEATLRGYMHPDFEDSWKRLCS